MPRTHDPMDFFCGDAWPMSGYLQDSAGEPLNLTDASIIWKLDTFDVPPVTLITLNVGQGIVINDVINGQITVMPSAAQTLALTPGNYRDSLRVILPGFDPFTEWTGLIRAAPPV